MVTALCTAVGARLPELPFVVYCYYIALIPPYEMHC